MHGVLLSNEYDIHGRWREPLKYHSYSHTIRRTTGTFGGGQCHHCSRSLSSCQNAEGCNLWWYL